MESERTVSEPLGELRFDSRRGLCDCEPRAGCGRYSGCSVAGAGRVAQCILRCRAGGVRLGFWGGGGEPAGRNGKYSCLVDFSECVTTDSLTVAARLGS